MGRRRWSLEEKRRIVELTLPAGASVARVAQAEGVNANQVFLWRRAYRNGELRGDGGPVGLLPVVIGSDAASVPEIVAEAEVSPVGASPAEPSGAIHIELPGRAMISVERGADRALLRTVLESLQR
jgi:transposase